MVMSPLRQLLELDLQPFHAQVHGKELQLLETAAKQETLAEKHVPQDQQSSLRLAQRLIALLRLQIEQTIQERNAISLKFASFRKGYGHAVTKEEHRELVLGLALLSVGAHAVGAGEIQVTASGSAGGGALGRLGVPVSRAMC